MNRALYPLLLALAACPELGCGGAPPVAPPPAAASAIGAWYGPLATIGPANGWTFDVALELNVTTTQAPAVVIVTSPQCPGAQAFGSLGETGRELTVYLAPCYVERAALALSGRLNADGELVLTGTASADGFPTTPIVYVGRRAGP